MKFFSTRKRGSSMALAIALATGSAVVATGVFPTEAHAQRKKKKKEAAEYSKEFLGVYQPLNEAVSAEGTDLTAYTAQLNQLADLSNSNDEKIAGGGLIYNAGIKLSDRAMQLKGMEMMLASNKVAIDQVGRYNFIAYQLADGEKEYTKARNYLQQAINMNFSTPQITPAGLQIAMAESYFSAEDYKAGLSYLTQAITSRENAGEAVEEAWYRRGLVVAYNNKITPEVYDFAAMWITNFPSATNWRDAVNLTRNLNAFEQQEILDLLRLSRETDALQDKQDYILYVENADARRLPKEVKDLIEEAYASDAVSRDDIYVADALATANGRIASDRADLPALEADADAADAPLRTVVAAAGAFLSYGDYAKAAKFYEKALGMPGVEAGEALTRLGMAQVGLGEYAAAKETLAKVEGKRAPIARLWSAYATEQGGGDEADSGPSLGDLMGASN